MSQLASISKHEVLTTCGGKMEDPEDFPSAVFHDRKVYFCNPACLTAFEAAPELFMAGKVEHPA